MACIDQWRLTHTTCPVDRQRFTRPLIRNLTVEGVLKKKRLIRCPSTATIPGCQFALWKATLRNTMCKLWSAPSSQEGAFSVAIWVNWRAILLLAVIGRWNAPFVPKTSHLKNVKCKRMCVRQRLYHASMHVGMKYQGIVCFMYMYSGRWFNSFREAKN